MDQPVSMPAIARDAILDWYDRHGRSLPFRATNDPYAILVSEAMAQQTQAARAGDAWQRFMARFPTVEALATATVADVLREWHGLGYNRRALNLWRAANRMMELHDGRVPSDLESLEALPGVGPYTARAVAAIAFGQPIGAVDTNVRRVLGRILAGEGGVLQPAALQALADTAVPPDRPAAWTHALMDLGATVCRPARPACGECPARAWCRYAEQGADVVAAAAPASARPTRDARARPQSFPSTTRWLRGRIVERLRTLPAGQWMTFDGPIGQHDVVAVAVTLAALARDGLIELEPGRRMHGDADSRARLATG